jgi:hypothetical protein
MPPSRGGEGVNKVSNNYDTSFHGGHGVILDRRAGIFNVVMGGGGWCLVRMESGRGRGILNAILQEFVLVWWGV